MVTDLAMVCRVQGAFRTDKDGMMRAAAAVVDSYQECQNPAVKAAHPKFLAVLYC